MQTILRDGSDHFEVNREMIRAAQDRERAEAQHSPGDARCNFCDGPMPCWCPTPPNVEKGWKR